MKLVIEEVTNFALNPNSIKNNFEFVFDSDNETGGQLYNGITFISQFDPISKTAKIMFIRQVDEENYEDYKSFTIAQNAKASVTEDLNDAQAVITFNLCD